MFNIAKLLDQCEIKFTGQQLEKLQVLLEQEFFKIILPKTHPEENPSDMSLTEDHTSNSNANENPNESENENENENDNENLNENQNQNQNGDDNDNNQG